MIFKLFITYVYQNPIIWYEHRLKKSKRVVIARIISIPKGFIGHLITIYNQLSKIAASSILEEEPFHSEIQSKNAGINPTTIGPS